MWLSWLGPKPCSHKMHRSQVVGDTWKGGPHHQRLRSNMPRVRWWVSFICLVLLFWQNAQGSLKKKRKKKRAVVNYPYVRNGMWCETWIPMIALGTRERDCFCNVQWFVSKPTPPPTLSLFGQQMRFFFFLSSSFYFGVYWFLWCEWVGEQARRWMKWPYRT